MSEFVLARTLRAYDTYRLYVPQLTSLDGGPVDLGDEGEAAGGFHLTGTLVRGWCRVKFGGDGINTGSGRLLLRMPVRRNASLLAGSQTGAQAPVVGVGRLRQSGSGGTNSQMLTVQFYGLAPLNVDHVWMMQHASNDSVSGSSPFTLGNNSRLSIRFSYPADPDAVAGVEEPS